MTQLSTNKSLGLKFAFFKKMLFHTSLFLAFLAVIYEFPASVVIGVWSSYGIANIAHFVDYRLLFAAVVIVVGSVNLLFNFKGVFRLREFWIYLIIMIYMVVVIWLNREQYAFMALTDTQSASAVDYWLPNIFKYSLFFFLGLHLIYLQAFRSLLLVSILVAGVVVLQQVDFEFLGLNRRDFVVGANPGVYLFLGDAFSITALICIALFKGNKSRLLIFVFSAVVIFLIGSRTSFIVFLFIVLLYFMLLFRVRWLPIYLALGLLVIGIGSTLDFTELADRNKRMIGVFTDFEDDNSVQGRRRFTVLGWEDIRNNPILGRFGGQRDSGALNAKEGWHSYMHNIVSYWRQFGIFVFIAIGYIYFRFVLGILARLKQKDTPEFRVYFLIGGFLIIESIFSRSFAFTSTHIIFGLVLTMYLPKRLMPNHKKSMGSEELLDQGLNIGENGRRRRKRRSKQRFSF